jgi:REP element-mobilizing transposase RayT
MERYRIAEDASVYFVTFSIVEWLPIFISEEPCRIIVDSFRHCHEYKGLAINAFVIMPTHLHAIVFDRNFDNARLMRALTDFRKFAGRSLADFCDSHAPTCIRAAIHEAAGDDRDRRIWQPSRHPEALTSEPFWRQKLDYLHDNPCRKGLVIRPEYWRFSSAGYLSHDSKWPCDVPLTPIVW